MSIIKLFIINGHNQVGKDTFVNILIDIAKENKKNIINYSTIDYVKNVAKFCGWDGIKNDKNRKFLCDLKNLLTEWNDISFKKCKEIIEQSKADAIFIHSREPEEIKRFVDYYQATTILVERNNIEICKSNSADLNVNNYNYDIVINNNRGLKELKEEAEIFYETFLKN